MKKACYSSLIFSYLLVGFILFYFNKINPDYKGILGVILSLVVVLIWIACTVILSLNKNRCTVTKKDKVEEWLGVIAISPLVAIAIIPFCIIYLVTFLIGFNQTRMKKKCKVLLSKGFALSKEKKNKKTVFFLSKENVVIKICEFDVYEISNDNGSTFDRIDESELILYDDRIEIENAMYKYRSCDYRDKDFYDPTAKIIEIVAKYF